MANQDQTATSSTSDDSMEDLVVDQEQEIQIEEAEPETISSSASQPPNTQYDQDALQAVQSVIERLVLRSDALQAKLREMNQSLRSILENDESLSEADEQAKQASLQAKDRKKQLAQSEEYQQLASRVRELREEMKEISESLNTHLLTYYTQTGVKVLDLSSGEREFVLNAKVKARSTT